MRKICAHYGRLYYRIFTASPAGFGISESSKRRLWGSLLALKELYPGKEKYPELLVYSEGKTGDTRYIVSYELFQYRILHSLPLPETDNIRSTAAIGAEMYPGYFGCYPVPFLTPWGCTTRNKIIANGLYWLETEQCQRGLAIAHPKYDDLSDGARGLAEQFDDGSAHTNIQLSTQLKGDDLVTISSIIFQLTP